jgi:hypothetical protein
VIVETGTKCHTQCTGGLEKVPERTLLVQLEKFEYEL